MRLIRDGIPNTPRGIRARAIFRVYREGLMTSHLPYLRDIWRAGVLLQGGKVA
jgi:hypothetical protein